MRLLLTDEEKVNVYSLPDTIKESSLFSYTSSITNVEVFFCVYAKDNAWFLKASSDFSTSTGVDTKLNLFESYEVKVKGISHNLILFTYADYNNSYTDISIDNIKEITVGSANNNLIVYPNYREPANDFILSKTDKGLVIKPGENNKNNTYVNNRLVEGNTLLFNGDMIFSNNLKLLCMNSFIRVFNNSNVINFASNIQILPKKLEDNKSFLNYEMKENDEGLYREDDYFFHKPRITYGYDNEEITIDDPPASEETSEIPIIFSIGSGLTMAVGSVFTAYKSIISYQKGSSSKAELVMSVITASLMLICSFLLPRILQKYNNVLARRKEAYRIKKYNNYLDRKTSEIAKLVKMQSQALYDNSPSSNECYQRIVGMKDKLWHREIIDKDFLSVRVGIGNITSSIKMNAPVEKFSLDEDQLINRAINVANTSKTLINVPVNVSLCDNFISSIICTCKNSQKYINGLMIQLLYSHNPKDLKIILLTDKENEYKWDYMKLVPHIKSNDDDTRYFASSEEEAKILLSKLESLYNDRVEEIKLSKDEINEELDKTNYYKNFNPYFLIVTDNYKKYRNIEFIEKMTNFNKNIGFSILMIDSNIKNIPNECNKYTYVTDTNSCVFEKTYQKSNQISFVKENDEDFDIYRVARELSNVPVQMGGAAASLPSMISFLELYNVGNIEQLNILNRWRSSDPIVSLSTPIGVSTSGELFKLDLHEKAHGPHGLIAGSTGSGKSEFIITYILSMCINYHPDEVKFVLIDYKGGGLAGAFENREANVKIPHLAGTITNLDVSEMNRTLVSINSELKRRQRKFNEAREKLGESTIDIYKYQKYYRQGLLDEPIPHLFIISDEFAELKAQQPEFMDELISTSRIGRSLGVHLILATQKPSGVVNDQIWSNSRFKICLKVQTRADSIEMLKREEAASIKETGRFYLQVGYDELFELGQSAWAGSQYIPSDKVIKKVDDSISFINNVGEIIKSSNNISVIKSKDRTPNNGDQLTNIVKYLYSLSLTNNIKISQLWLPSIPSEIYLIDVIKKYNYQPEPYKIDMIIGEYDDPASQKQGLYSIDITNTGNVLIYGIPGSGKENLLTTAITSVCTRHTPDEVNFYILDFGAETLTKFKDFPQVGDIAFISEYEKINNLYSILTKEISKRKKLFSDYMGSYNNYIRLSGKKIESIICIIHGFETFNEVYPNLSENFTSLFKDGPGLGISFVVTNSLSTGIRIKTLQLFPNKLSLALNDKDDYRFVLDSPRGLVPANHFGRGIGIIDKPVEFQTAYISKPDDITKSIMDLAAELKKNFKSKAPNIPTMPAFVTVDAYVGKEQNLTEIPVGISKNKLSTITYDFSDNFVPILSTDISSKVHFLYGLIEILKQVPDTKIRIIDVLKLYNNSQGVDLYNKDFEILIRQIKLEIDDDENLNKTNIFIIIGLGAFKNNVSNETQEIFSDVFIRLKEYKKNKFIIFDDYNSYKSLDSETWFNKNVSSNYGIWLGENADNQLAIKMPNLSGEERKITFNQMGVVVKNSTHTIIRHIVDKEYDDEK